MINGCIAGLRVFGVLPEASVEIWVCSIEQGELAASYR